MPQPVAKNYVGENDEVVLEDEVQRIQLIGNIDIPKLVTGIEEHYYLDTIFYPYLLYILFPSLSRSFLMYFDNFLIK